MMTPVNVHIKLLDPELPAPTYAKPGDAGADLRSALTSIWNRRTRLVPTGVAIALPKVTSVWCTRALAWRQRTVSPS